MRLALALLLLASAGWAQFPTCWPCTDAQLADGVIPRPPTVDTPLSGEPTYGPCIGDGMAGECGAVYLEPYREQWTCRETATEWICERK